MLDKLNNADVELLVKLVEQEREVIYKDIHKKVIQDRDADLQMLLIKLNTIKELNK